MTNHIDIHTDIAHEDTHIDTPEIAVHTDVEVRHQDIHADIDVSKTATHIDNPQIPAIVVHTDYIAILNSRQNYHEDIPRITFHADSSFRVDESFETKLDEEDK